MTYNEIVTQLRRLLSDEQGTGFSESETLEDPHGELELVSYLDRAVHAYSHQQAELRNPLFMKRMSIVDGNNVPDDFIKFCGAVPVKIEGGKIQYFGEAETIGQIGGNPVNYFARLPLVSSYSGTDVLPYSNEQCIRLTELARVYAMNKHEYNIQQDLALLNEGVNYSNGVPYQQTRKR